MKGDTEKYIQMKYNNLVEQIGDLVRNNRQGLWRAINTTITVTYWKIGQYIVEFEQKGKERAQYGASLLRNLSKDLTQQFGKGYSYRNLQLAKKFYNTFPIWQSMIFKSSTPIVQSMTAQSFSADLPPVERALLNCSWTHIVRLLSIKDETERTFYLLEAVANNWTVRELNRQINTALFERSALSQDKERILKQLTNSNRDILKVDDIIKEPMVFEFLGLDNTPNLSENELETAIINNIEKFLLELGKGFSFVARQYRISAGADNFYIDLVFYNRLLQSHVLIDLKIGKLKHQDIGQMQMYVNYFDREIKINRENPTIGIILCKEKNEFVVEYSLSKDNKQIYPKEYLLYLPNKEEFKELLKRYV